VRLSTPAAILIGSLLVVGAILLHGQSHPNPHYTLASNNGLLVRMDTRDGQTVACLPGEDDSGERIVVTCTGKRP
jgi:hypothetical protein